MELYEPVERAYPSADDRFEQVIEQFRLSYGNEIVASDMFMRPYLLLSHLCGIMKINPADAFDRLSELRSSVAKKRLYC